MQVGEGSKAEQQRTPRAETGPIPAGWRLTPLGRVCTDAVQAELEAVPALTGHWCFGQAPGWGAVSEFVLAIDPKVQEHPVIQRVWASLEGR